MKKPEPTSSSKEDELQKENHDEAAKVALEAIFPVENAKRSAVVAITNAYAIDVLEKDGNTYVTALFLYP